MRLTVNLPRGYANDSRAARFVAISNGTCIDRGKELDGQFGELHRQVRYQVIHGATVCFTNGEGIVMRRGECCTSTSGLYSPVLTFVQRDREGMGEKAWKCSCEEGNNVKRGALTAVRDVHLFFSRLNTLRLLLLPLHSGLVIAARNGYRKR